MNDNLYIRILEELEKAGIGIEKDISYIFNTEDKIVEETLENVKLGNRSGSIEELLKSMKNMEHISSYYFKEKPNDDVKRLIHPIEAHARITIKGFTELCSFKNSNVQNSFISYQKISIMITCAISLLALIISLKSCSNEKTLEDLKSRINIIETHNKRPEFQAK
jgi:hypothetical protein